MSPVTPESEDRQDLLVTDALFQSDQALKDGNEPLSGYVGVSLPYAKRTWTPSSRLTSVASWVILLGLWVALMVGGLSHKTKTNAIGCDSNGDVYSTNITSGSPSIWSPKYTFTVNLGFGQLSYTAAKILDESWNLVIGRGGQVIGGLLIYHIFRGPVVRALEQQKNLYRTTIGLQYAPASLGSLWCYFDEAKYLSRCSHLTTILLVLSVLFIMILQTWLSAMTGYQAISLPYTRWANNSLISINDLPAPCMGTIADGDRVELSSPFCISSPADWQDVSNYAQFLIDYAVGNWSSLDCERAPVAYGDADDGFPIQYCSAPAQSNFTFRGRTQMLDAPTLDLSILTMPLLSSPNHDSWILQQPITQYLYGNSTLTENYVLENGICQPQKVYEWGFSFLLAFTFLVTATCFAIWLQIFWTYGDRMSREHARRMLGPLKTAITIANRLREDLREDVGQMSQAEIDQVFLNRKARRRFDRERQTEIYKATMVERDKNDAPMLEAARTGYSRGPMVKSDGVLFKQRFEDIFMLR